MSSSPKQMSADPQTRFGRPSFAAAAGHGYVFYPLYHLPMFM